MRILLRHLKSKASIVLIGFLSVTVNISQAQIQVDSIKTILSTCPNNGSISIYAKSSHPPLLYSITGGPVTQAQQTSPVFNSLPPGNYTLKISDGSGSSTVQSAAVAGTYKALDFKPTTTAPSCVGSSDGSIKGNVTATTGKAPFTWQLMAPSPVTTAPQSSDRFTSLPAGNYTIRLTDDCGSFRTIVATVGVPNTKMLFGYFATIKTGCDSIYVSHSVENAYRLPLTFKYETKNGVFITTHPTILDTTNTKSNGYAYISQLLPNLDYGDDLKITVYNSCGDSVFFKRTILPFMFYPTYDYNSCGTTIQPSFWNFTNNLNYSDGLKAPVKYSFTDISTHTVVDEGTISVTVGRTIYDTYINGVTIKSVDIGKTYQLMIKDGCGRIFQQNYTMPALAPPKIYSRSINSKACIDSVTGTYRVVTVGLSDNASLILLSGPAKLGSTKPGYAYTDTYTYPDTIKQAYSNNFLIGNLAIGTYQFEIIDDCGHRIQDKIVIYPENVTNLGTQVSYKKGCLGQNKIYFSIPGDLSGGGATITVKDQATGVLLKSRTFSSYNSYKDDSILNVPSGKYVVTYQFAKDPPYAIPHNDTDIPCWVVRDTITIEEYQTPVISTSNAISCHDKITMVLTPDLSKGVPPYQYEIVSSPENFPVQNSNIFTASQTGIYTARIFDVCGNASTKQIAIDSITLAFAPLSVVKTCDRIRYEYPASSYYSYKWTRPNKTTFLSEKLDIHPITPQDTGTYQVMKVVNIAGCKDTLYASYHVSLSDVYKLDSTICYGSTLTIGTHHYNNTGIYKDTLLSSTGCDSIVELNLNVIKYKYGSLKKSMCPGETLVIGGHSYNQAGTYSDTVATATCDSVTVIELSHYPLPLVDLGPDTSFCEGKTFLLRAGSGQAAYFWNNEFTDSIRQQISVDQKGKYWVEVKNQYGCKNSDTLEIKELFQLPTAQAGKDTSTCAGETLQLKASGGNTYKWWPGGEQQAVIQVRPLVSTTYTLTAYDAHQCGTATDQVTVFVNPFPEQPFKNHTITHCFDDGPLILSADGSGTFLWTATGETSPTITTTEGGTYEVKVFNEWNCTVTGQVQVNAYCEPRLFVPKAFSPNGDGINDELEIFGSNFTNFNIMVFNRWGEIIFVSNDRNIRWDGMYRGEEMIIGTYPWIISYESIYDPEQKQQMKGSVTLIR